MASKVDGNTKKSSRNKQKLSDDTYVYTTTKTNHKTAKKPENLCHKADERNHCKTCNAIFRLNSDLITHCCPSKTQSKTAPSFLVNELPKILNEQQQHGQKILPSSQTQEENTHQTSPAESIQEEEEETTAIQDDDEETTENPQNRAINTVMIANCVTHMLGAMHMPFCAKHVGDTIIKGA